MHPNPKNPRNITDKKLAMLKKSLETFGDLGGIVVNESSQQIVGGHQRVKALLGGDGSIPEGAVRITKRFSEPTRTGTIAEGHIVAVGAHMASERYPYRVVRWDESRERAANLSANKGAGEFDLDAVADWLGDLETADIDLDLTMFDVDDRDALLLGEVPPSLAPVIAPSVNPDVDRLQALGELGEEEIPESAPRVCELGDVWQLGKHRLVCGDATDPAVVESLMAGKKADLVFTSPPYAQQRDYKNKIMNWDALMQGVFGNLPAHEKTQVLVNLGLVHRDGEWQPYWDGWVEWMRGQGWKRKGWYVWDKGYAVPTAQHSRMQPAHEWVFHFCKTEIVVQKTAVCRRAGEKNSKTSRRNAKGEVTASNCAGLAVQDNKIPDSVFRITPEQARGLHSAGHPAVFPTKLPAEVLAAFTDADAILYEPFAGSGTSIIAAEMMGRTCYAAEIALEYCDIVLARWKKNGGDEPVLAPSPAPKRKVHG